MINEDCGCGHKEKPTHMLQEPTEEQPGIKDVLKTALSKAIKQKSMNEEQATNFIREVIKKIGNKYVLYPKSGGKRLGTHNSRSAAERQERAIYANK